MGCMQLGRDHRKGRAPACRNMDARLLATAGCPREKTRQVSKWEEKPWCGYRQWSTQCADPDVVSRKSQMKYCLRRACASQRAKHFRSCGGTGCGRHDNGRASHGGIGQGRNVHDAVSRRQTLLAFQAMMRMACVLEGSDGIRRPTTSQTCSTLLQRRESCGSCFAMPTLTALPARAVERAWGPRVRSRKGTWTTRETCVRREVTASARCDRPVRRRMVVVRPP